jgi:hypothetical protein
LVEFKKVSEIVNDSTIINICTSKAESIKVLEWQPYGEFEANTNVGVRLEDQVFIEKARKFIHLAKEICSDIVLTPEYCFPYKVLDEIIDNKSMWPEKGWLWCFGTQGDSRAGFMKRLELWAQSSDVIVEDYAFKSLESRIFISPLIYLFKRNDDRLCILPQLKIGTMKDPWHDFEADGLCKGSTIFIFDLCGNKVCKNVFLSVICADVSYNIADSLSNNDNIPQDSITLFHPQLNPNPRHIDFRSARNDLIYKNGKQTRIITLNWAEDTKTYVNNKRILFMRPFSAFYIKSSYKDQDEGHRTLRRRNFKKGTFFAYNRETNTDIWYSHRFEHCKLFYIKKGYYASGSSAVTGWEEPDTKQSYVFDLQSSEWKPDNLPCRYNMDKIIYSRGSEYDYPLTLCNQNSPTCTLEDCCVDKCDFFFSLCFGNYEKYELITHNELVERIVVGSDVESDNKRKQKAIRYYQLIDLLKNNCFPESLSHFIDNHKFEIHYSFPNVGTNCYNLVQKDEDLDNRDLKALAVIIDNIHEENELQELIKCLSDRFDKRYRQQICIYYIPDGSSTYTYYDKHLLQTSILKSHFSRNQASVFRSEF